MLTSLWTGIALGLAISFPEARRIYRKYDLMLAGAMWPAVAAVIAIWAFLTIEFYRASQPAINHVFFTIYHLLLIVIAPAVLTILVGRKYNLSVGVLVGGSLLIPTALFFFAMALGAGGL